MNLSIDELNTLFEPLSYPQRLKKLYEVFSPKDVLFTSSFGTKSVFLLDWIKRVEPRQQVHFLDTSYHFPETLTYVEELRHKLALDVIRVAPETRLNQISREQQLWLSNTDRCCHYNKVLPMRRLKSNFSVWISGLMASGTAHRQNLRIFEAQDDIIKFHPILDIDEGEFLYHLDRYNLPRHPLEAQGYGSIGCSHCTVKGKGREGRWKGSKKTECGLHVAVAQN